MQPRPILSIAAATFLVAFNARAQSLYPVKQGLQWGLMDKNGKIVVQPRYDAIGEFDTLGYALVQEKDKTGIVSKLGDIVLPPRYPTAKDLLPGLFAVMEDNLWKLVDSSGNQFLPGDCHEIKPHSKKHLLYQVGAKWGVLSRTGEVLSPPGYDSVTTLTLSDKGFLILHDEGRMGLMRDDGFILLPPQAELAVGIHPGLFFFKKGEHWQAIDQEGVTLPFGTFDSYRILSPAFISLYRQDTASLLDVRANKLIPGRKGQEFINFDTNHVLCRSGSLVGLMKRDGRALLSQQYAEISIYNDTLMRARKPGSGWGVVAPGDVTLIPFEYSFIAGVRGGYGLLSRGGRQGLATASGELLLEAKYTRIDVDNRMIKAWEGERLDVIDLSGDSQDKEVRELGQAFTIRLVRNSRRRADSDSGQAPGSGKFEWFFDPGVSKYGLRRLDNGKVQIAPAFDHFKEFPKAGLTMVQLEARHRLMLDRTEYEFNNVYGLVNNDTGLLVHMTELLDLDTSQLNAGKSYARCVYSDGRHGLVRKTGKVLARGFAYIGPFNEGLAMASLNGQLTALPPKMRGALPSLGSLKGYLSGFLSSWGLKSFTRYDWDLDQFGDLVCKGCRWGYIDTLGRWAVPPVYEVVQPFSHGVGIVFDGVKWGAVDKSGMHLLPCQYDRVWLMKHQDSLFFGVYVKSGKLGLIDSLGRMVLAAAYDEIGVFQEGRVAVRKGRAWGFADREGREVIPCRYQEVRAYSEGLAAVRLRGRWGYIDKDGNTVLDFSLAKAGSFHDGLAAAKGKESFWGYIDKGGNWALPPAYYKAQDFEGGVARVEVKAGSHLRTALIDKEGRYVLKPRYSGFTGFDRHGLARVENPGKHPRQQLVNRRGELVGTADWRAIHPFKEGLARVEDEQTGYIDTTGRLVIPTAFAKAGDFSGGLAVAWEGFRCGYIDKSGGWVIEPRYTECADFSGGMAMVEADGRATGLVDSRGREVFSPGEMKLQGFSQGKALAGNKSGQYFITADRRYVSAAYQEARPFEGGIAPVKTLAGWTVINSDGIPTLSPKFEKVGGFEGGYARVTVKGLFGLANVRGELIIEPVYDFMSNTWDGLLRLEQGSKVGYADFEGNWVWELQD